MLDGVLEDVRRGASRVLVVRGEAGIGKTALLDHLVDRAEGLQVVRGAGVESEMELAYASLHQVCAPMLERLERLPGPQREALEIVFGLSAGPAPERFLVGLATLSLFADAGEERPLLCVVDDAQWLDQASALTLAFVARRLHADPVGIVFGAREPARELQQLPELPLSGLRNGDARALLERAVRMRLDDRVRDRIIAETRGNPLALLELPRGLSATELAGGFGLLGADTLSARIEQSYLRRLDAAAPDTRRLLLLAAAEPVGDPLLLWRAAERLGVPRAAADGAEAEGLLSIARRVTFRHPLVRSAVYRSASPAERRATHLALAEATDGAADPDRRAWHLAAAAEGPDEAVAEELERSAARAQARGGLAAAAAFLERAVTLTSDTGRRADRALAAAQASLHAGAFPAALILLDRAQDHLRDDLQRARALLLRGQVAFASSAGSDAPPLLIEAAQALEPLDVPLARETYLDAWGAALFAGRLAGEGDIYAVSRAAAAAPRPDGPARPADLLLDGLATLMTDGRAAAAPILREATGAFLRDDASAADHVRWGWLATVPFHLLWDDASWHALSTRQLRHARQVGALARLPIDLTAWAILLTFRGDFRRAGAAIAEADAVTRETGTRIAPYAATLLDALRGREPDASQRIRATAEQAVAGGQGIGVQWADWCEAVLHNALGDHERALSAAQRATADAPELFITTWALSELVEAAARTGRADLAADALARLEEATAVGANDRALGVAARARALVVADAEPAHREAVERLARTPMRPELARAQLLYGEWLRERDDRRADARAQLHVARDAFAEIGMEAFAERARAALLATGAKVRRHDAPERDELTEQEREIARLAREGLSNPEIGAQLFLSPRTVEWHLRKVFAKLGIRSRRELPD